MSAPLSSIPSLIPLPQNQIPDQDENEDRFASLFSPPTPPASPRVAPIFTNTRPYARPIPHSRTPSSADSEFGSFVSVPATEDPLHGLSNDDALSSTQPPFTPHTLEFFEHFTSEAKSAAEKNKHSVLDELLAHEDDPLFLSSQPQPPAQIPSQSNAELPSSAPRVGESTSTTAPWPGPLVDFDLLQGQSREPTPQPTHRHHHHHPSREHNLSSPAPVRSSPIAIDTPPTRPSTSDPHTPPSPRLLRSQTATTPPSSSYSSRWLPSMLTSRAYPQEERTPVSALFANAVSSGSKTIPLAIPSTSKSIPAPAPKGHQLMHAGSLPVLGTIGRVVGESLDTDVNVKHGTPFAAHAFVPSSGAPGFDGARSLNPKGFEYDSKTVERASVNLAGRKEMTTPVLTVDLADKIRAHLPALARLPRTWNLLYSLDQHGISLKTLYARCQNHLKGTLVVVKDSGDALFGAWIGDGIRVSPGAYYGSGESFLWRVRGGNVQVYRWSGRNDYVALCEQKFISFGGGDGHYGLFLDDQLFEGSSAPCPTFNNEALCSDGPRKGSTVSFECVGVEVWGMG